ncbi:MAG: hypothetical protein E6Q40_10230 [Cupriavidus sp.]|nr:MAG: hypothetical protein E6Q40_10230 [Cupriavidus sp.]
MTAIHGAKYLYEVEVAALHAANFIAFDKPIEDQSDAIQAAAAALKMHDPLSRHESHLKASGNYLRQAAETAASAFPGIYSRDILLQHGVTGFVVVDGRAESDRIVVVYDPAILRIKCRHDLAQADRGRA